MRAIALKMMALWGWRRVCLSTLLGAFSAFAMEPFSLLPVLFVIIPVLVWMLDGADLQASGRAGAFRSGFMIGWSFGFGYFLAGLYWVASAFYVQAELHGWMVPLVLLLFPLFLGLFWAVGCGVAAVFWTQGIARLVVLAAAFAGVEWLRGNILTGFPWNAPGFAVAGSDQLSQIAAYAGISGLNFFVILITAAPALLADEYSRRNLGGYGNWISFGALGVLLAALWGGGHYSLHADVPANEEPIKLRVVQPNIAQKDKWDPAFRSQIFASYIELSDAATSPEVNGIDDVDVVIWPESAPPFLLEQDASALAAIAALLPEGTVLLTGALRVEQTAGEGDSDASRRRVFNSILALDDTGTVAARYDKFHLVPFGEYVPLAELLEPLGLRKLVNLPGGFTAGSAARTIAIPGVPAFGPLICYEVIFPRFVVDHADRPNWLLNVTNDAWFGDSAGPRQHLQSARFRAIEQGLPVVRAANTGISAVIDAKGRVLNQLPMGVRGVIDATLPGPAPTTLYATYGDWVMLVIVGLSLFLCLVVRPGRAREHHGAAIDLHTDGFKK